MSRVEVVAEPLQGIAALEGRLGYGFAERGRLRTALTHRSHTADRGAQNETLEFLGDAVVGLAVSELLVRAWPEADEGRLSRRRAALVNAETLAAKAAALDLGPLILLGRGEEKSGGREKRSILAGAFEAVLGAVFLDGGYAPARELVARLFAADVAVDPGLAIGEFKTRLQELAQRLYRTGPEYTLLRTMGPDHARAFESRVSIAGRELGVGAGPSKKLAEQAAACQALEALEAAAGALESAAQRHGAAPEESA